MPSTLSSRMMKYSGGKILFAIPLGFPQDSFRTFLVSNISCRSRRFDGLVHVCARARSVVDIIAADAGDPSYTTDHISSSRSPNKCEAPRGFPPNGWKIGVISVEMPVKVYEWSSV